MSSNDAECGKVMRTRRVSKAGPDPSYPSYVVGDSDKAREEIQVAALTQPRSTSDQMEELLRRLLAGVATPARVPAPVLEVLVVGGVTRIAIRNMMPDAVGTLSQFDCDYFDLVGLYGTLSPSIQNSVGPVGLCGTLSPSDYVGPMGPFGTLSPSIQDSVGPYGTLYPSIQDSIGPVGPYGTLSPSTQDSIGLYGRCLCWPGGPAWDIVPSIQDYIGPVGPYGTLSLSIQDSVGPSGILTRLLRTRLAR